MLDGYHPRRYFGIKSKRGTPRDDHQTHIARTSVCRYWTHRYRTETSKATRGNISKIWSCPDPRMYQMARHKNIFAMQLIDKFTLFTLLESPWLLRLTIKHFRRFDANRANSWHIILEHK